MSEDSVEFSEGLNAKRIAEYLTYASTSGRVTPEAKGIASLWRGVAQRYLDEIIKKKTTPGFEVIRNKFGATHTVDREKEQMHSNPSRARLFFKACESLVFGKRYSDEGVEISDGGKKLRHIPYSSLDENPEEVQKLGNQKIRTTVKFRDESGKPTGTVLHVDGNEMRVFQKIKVLRGQEELEEEVLVLQIKGNSGDLKTEMVAIVDTEAGSRAVAFTDSSKAFWQLRDGLLWGDVYPYPASVSDFMSKIENNEAAKSSETELTSNLPGLE